MTDIDVIGSGSSGGGNPWTTVTKSSGYTALAWDRILVDATAGPVTITLPLSASNSNTQIEVVKTDSSANAVTLAGTGSDKISGNASVTLPGQFDGVTLASDGSANWYAF